MSSLSTYLTHLWDQTLLSVIRPLTQLEIRHEELIKRKVSSENSQKTNTKSPLPFSLVVPPIMVRGRSYVMEQYQPNTARKNKYTLDLQNDPMIEDSSFF